MTEMVRINTRISKTLNEWLDSESAVTGVPKSTLVFLALEQYKQQHEAVKTINNMNMLNQRIDELERALHVKK